MRFSRERKKAIKSYILSFILMICFILFSIISLGNYSMLSQHGIIHTCDRIEYYDYMNSEMVETAYEMGIPYGIKRNYIKDIFDNTQIKKDVQGTLKGQESGTLYTVNTEAIGKKIQENTLKGEGKLSSSQKESLQAYVLKVGQMYQKKMIIPGSDYIVKLLPIMKALTWIGIPILIFLIIFLIFWLVSTRSVTYHGLRFVCYSVIGAGLTLVTGFSGMISNSFIYKFNMSNAYMRRFYTYWLGHEMLMQVFFGIGLLLAGCVLCYMVYRQKFRAK